MTVSIQFYSVRKRKTCTFLFYNMAENNSLCREELRTCMEWGCRPLLLLNCKRNTLSFATCSECFWRSGWVVNIGRCGWRWIDSRRWNLMPLQHASWLPKYSTSIGLQLLNTTLVSFSLFFLLLLLLVFVILWCATYVRAKIKERLAQQIDSGLVDKEIFEEALKELEVESYKKFLRSDEYAGYESYTFNTTYPKLSHITTLFSYLHDNTGSWQTRESLLEHQALNVGSLSLSSSRRSLVVAALFVSVLRLMTPIAPSLLKVVWTHLNPLLLLMNATRMWM